MNMECLIIIVNDNNNAFNYQLMYRSNVLSKIKAKEINAHSLLFDVLSRFTQIFGQCKSPCKIVNS